jgi:peptidoglycan/LPS O-acetylase OafA/YrhL
MENTEKNPKKSDLRDRMLKSAAWSAAVMFVFYAIWVFVVWLLLRCRLV